MLIDANVLIYALNDEAEKQERAQAFLQQHRREMVFSQQTLFESVRILTHQRFPDPYSSAEALDAIQDVVQRSPIIHQVPSTYELAQMYIRDYKISGVEVFDAVLAATAVSNGVEVVVSDNEKHMVKYEDIELMNPFQRFSSN
jgi:predicted nucleic acid-binding protein